VLAARGVRIAGVGHYTPPNVLTNADLEKTLDTNDEWITTRTGIKERRIGSPGSVTSDFALAAARIALERAGVTAHDLDAVIVGTVSGDYQFPATACILSDRLGIRGKTAFDIEIACSGFVFSLTTACALVRSGMYERVLVVGAEKLSSIVNYNERATAILFGDGAGAAVLEAADVDSYLSSHLGTDGSDPSMLWIEEGGSKYPTTTQGYADGKFAIAMRGREIFKTAVEEMVGAAKTVLAAAGLTVDDIDIVIPHQANLRIIESLAKYLGVPMEKVFLNIHKYGNTSAASVGIALSEAWEAGLVTSGKTVLFLSFGGGLSWGAVLWKW
jgi:3-oxoacyl-[acyl-carrier-protein] synthase-3